MASEQQKETAFLKRCLRHDENPAGRQLEAQIAQVERKERCLNRAKWLVALLAALGGAGLGYEAVLMDGLPGHAVLFTSRFVLNASCALLLASLISLIAFTALGRVYTWELNRLREECRQLLARLLESSLRGAVLTKPGPPPGEPQTIGLGTPPTDSPLNVRRLC